MRKSLRSECLSAAASNQGIHSIFGLSNGTGRHRNSPDFASVVRAKWKHVCNICDGWSKWKLDNRPVVSAMLPKQPYSLQNSQDSCSSPGPVAVYGIVNSIIPNHSDIVLPDCWKFALPQPLSRRPVAELRPRLALCREFPPCLKWRAASPLKYSHVQEHTSPLRILAPKFISIVHASKSIRRISVFFNIKWYYMWRKQLSSPTLRRAARPWSNTGASALLQRLQLRLKG